MQSPMPNDEGKRPEARRTEKLLHAIIEGTATVTGREFFVSLVKHLATGLGVRYSLIAECLPNHRARSLAFWTGVKPGLASSTTCMAHRA